MNYMTIRNRVITLLVVFLSIIVITAVVGYRSFPEIDRDVATIQSAIEGAATLDHTPTLEAIADIRTADAAALRNLVMIVGVTIVFGSLCAFLIYRNFGALARLIGHVHTAGVEVSSSVTQIAATAREQQATATEIAATTTEIGATSREIAATSRELLKTMNDVSSVVEQTASTAGSGQSSLARMEDTMQHVMEAAASINGKLGILNEKAAHINQVITTITKVADQTNLLSLNAAIEAEKAGELGRGFAIVATEIRRLADQTAVATFDIEKIVKEIQSAITAGVMGMDKFSEEVRRGMQEVQHAGLQLSEIIQQVQALPPRFGTVNDGMQAQVTGAEQISEALRQLSEASQQTVESLRQSSEAVTGLNQVAVDLRGAVSRFTLQAAT